MISDGQRVNAAVTNAAFLSKTAATTATVAAVTISNTTQSTDKDTGALIIEGGVGVEKNLNVGGALAVTGAAAITGNLTVTGDLTINGTNTTLNTSVIESEDNNILLNKGGNDASAESGGVDVVRTSDNGAFRFDSSLTSKWKLGLASAMYEVLVAGLAQTISGIKTFTAALGLAEVSTPATPSAGYRKLYAKTDGFYGLDSSGNEIKLGEGAYESYATAGGTKTLTAASAKYLFLTGSNTIETRLPATTALVNGNTWVIQNDSSVVQEVCASTAYDIAFLRPKSRITMTCINNSIDLPASWSFYYDPSQEDYTDIATTGGTIALAFATSPRQIRFTGTNTQTVTLPLGTGFFGSLNVKGDGFLIINESTGALTVNNYTGSLLKTVAPGESYFFVVVATGTNDGFAVASGYGNWVTPTGTQTLTNKDLDGGTASNTSRITIPKAAKATLDALTRKEGTIVYASDTNTPYFDDGTTLIAPLINPMTTGGDIIYGGASGVPTRLANGTAGQVLQSNGTTVAPSWQTSKTLIQNLNFTTGAVATGTTQIPADDTIPQITEGDEYMTLAITPTSATSILEVTVVHHASSNVGGQFMTVALFQDAVANALAVGNSFMPTGTTLANTTFTFRMTSGTTSTITFRVRSGTSGATTVTFNGSSGGRYFGGKLASSITIKEYAP